MAELALTAAKIAPVFTDPGHCECYMVKVGEAVTAGEALYWHTDGTMLIADGNVDAEDEAQAVALQAGIAGDVISVLRRGCVYGFTVAAVNVGTVIHLSDTPGDFQHGAGDEPVGRVWALADGTRVVYFDFLVQADIG